MLCSRSRYSLTWCGRSTSGCPTSPPVTASGDGVGVVRAVPAAVVSYRNMTQTCLTCKLSMYLRFHLLYFLITIWDIYIYSYKLLSVIYWILLILLVLFAVDVDISRYPFRNLYTFFFQIFYDLVRQINRQTPENPVKKTEKKCNIF